MTPFRCVILLQLTTILALGQLAQQSKQPTVAANPTAVVRSLYHVVVVRHPIGLPAGADMKALTPYLSKALLHRIDLAQACSTDWARQHPDPNLKPPSVWIEDGFFSGGNERALPGAFHVERVQPEKDGSFRAHVRLKYSEPAPKPYWYVDAIVTKENSHFVIDDVVFPRDDWDEESRLSQSLTEGCDGARWVGHGEQ
jgi:hypothetical protein